MEKRDTGRTIRRFEVEYSPEGGGDKQMGISSNFSEKGLFIRTSRGYHPGSKVNILLKLDNGKTLAIKGLVVRTSKTGFSSMGAIKDGMGIEIIEAAPEYKDFLEKLNN